MEEHTDLAYTEFDCEIITENEEEGAFEVLDLDDGETKEVSSSNAYLTSLHNSCNLVLRKEDAIKTAYEDNAEAGLFGLFIQKSFPLIRLLSEDLPL